MLKSTVLRLEMKMLYNIIITLVINTGSILVGKSCFQHSNIQDHLCRK